MSEERLQGKNSEERLWDRVHREITYIDKRLAGDITIKTRFMITIMKKRLERMLEDAETNRPLDFGFVKEEKEAEKVLD